jgi:hypothetical protein
MDYLSTKIGPPYIATNHYNKQTHNKENFVDNKIIIFSRFNYSIVFGLYEYCFQSQIVTTLRKINNQKNL